MIRLLTIGLAASCALASPTWARESGIQEPSEVPAPVSGGGPKADGSRDFAGLKLGVGLSLTIDFGGIDRVNEAELVNDIVRVTDEDDARARVMLESHYFFTPDRAFLVPSGNWGVGPFVAVQPGTDEIIEAAALGVMVGFKRPDTTGQSFNIGLGVSVDPNTRVLGSGLRADEPLPSGETAIRYREESQYGWVILTSFTF